MCAVLDKSLLKELTVVELVREAQAGCRDAFGELFRRYERHVYTAAMRRLNDHGEAEELCQDVFVQALLKIKQLREPEAFGGWLRSITNRMAINRIVRGSHDRAVEQETLEAACVDRNTPLTAAISGEQRSQVQAGLDQLRELDRETLVKFYVEGHSLNEMSDEFDAPLGTIKRRLHVARKRLAKQMEPLVAV